MTPISRTVDRASSSEDKLALFGSLFRGREEIYRVELTSGPTAE